MSEETSTPAPLFVTLWLWPPCPVPVTLRRADGPAEGGLRRAPAEAAAGGASPVESSGELRRQCRRIKPMLFAGLFFFLPSTHKWLYPECPLFTDVPVLNGREAAF